VNGVDKKIIAFPPTVDLESANWTLYGPEANGAITARNNQIVARLAARNIELGDHIYGFPMALRLNGEEKQ